MSSQVPATRLTVPLYHGTASCFLSGILQSGLGGADPLTELNLFNLARELVPLIDSNLRETEIYKAKFLVFSLMAEQASRAMNFQHGSTYVSPSKETAVRYASRNKYGSEFLTHTLDFLKELVDRDVPAVRTEMFQRYRRLFGLLDVSPAPLLFTVKGIALEDLLTEHGSEPTDSIAFVKSMMAEFPEDSETMLQQSNFRLTFPVWPPNFSVSLINVAQWRYAGPTKYTLHEILVPQHEAREPAQG